MQHGGRGWRGRRGRGCCRRRRTVGRPPRQHYGEERRQPALAKGDASAVVASRVLLGIAVAHGGDVGAAGAGGLLLLGEFYLSGTTEEEDKEDFRQNVSRLLAGKDNLRGYVEECRCDEAVYSVHCTLYNMQTASFAGKKACKTFRITCTYRALKRKIPFTLPCSLVRLPDELHAEPTRRGRSIIAI